MKKYLAIFMLLILVQTLCSCAPADDLELVYKYNGNLYTTECPYGTIKKNWNFMDSEQWEEITITQEWGNEKGSTIKGEKIKGDSQSIFIRMHELYCVRKDIKLPTIEENQQDISYIEYYFHSDEENIRITDRDKIAEFADVIISGNKNNQKSGDTDYEYVGNIHIFYKNFPSSFFPGRIMEDKNGELFFSSDLNPNVRGNFFGVEDFYSVPITVDLIR